MVELILNILTMSLPYRVLAYYPFRKRIRLPWAAVLALIFASEAVVRVAVYLVGLNGGNSRALEFILFPICAVIFFCCTCMEPSKLLFFYLFVTDHIIIVRGLTVFVLARFLPGSGLFSLPGYLIHLAFFVVTLPLVLRVWYGTVKRMIDVRSPGLWRTIWISPAFTTAVILGYTYDIGGESAGSLRFLFSRVGLFACMIMVYYVLLQSLDTIRVQTVLEEQARAGGELLALQRRQYELLARRIEEIRTARHDLRQHLKLIQTYLANGDKKALADYVAAYGETLPSDTVELFCENPAVNAIVSFYGEKARNQGVAFETRLDLPAQLPVSDPDFCVVVGNLLENALEALGADRPGAFLEISASVKAGKELILTVDNGPVKEPLMQDGQLISSKHEGTGIGTASVKRVAAHYHGVADFSWKEGVFYASVYLRASESVKGA